MNIRVLTAWAIITWLTFFACCIYLAFQHDKLMQRVSFNERCINALIIDSAELKLNEE